MTLIRRGFPTVLLTFALSTSSFGVVGVGIHWGNDFTLRMEDAEKEWLRFDNLNIGTSGINGVLPSELSTAISGRDQDLRESILNAGQVFQCQRTLV